MSEGLGVMAPAKHAVEIDAHQGGNKAAERGGANKGIVDHHEVDKIDHAGHASRAKSAMADMGHYNVSYYNGGKMG
jgi:hypothetical protein